MVAAAPGFRPVDVSMQPGSRRLRDLWLHQRLASHLLHELRAQAMAVMMVPPVDARPWPTLGPDICDLLEERCVHGPGDLKGKPFRLNDQNRALIYRLYEVFPRSHPRAGKRRFKRAAISLRKGTAKTEDAAAIAFVELHPEAPVRTDGWKRVGSAWVPVGRPIVDPYIPMVAYTEEQTEDLAYAALLAMCTLGPDADLFDSGLDRIIRLDEHGRADGTAKPLASAPDARDGARTTFQHFDETHRFVLPRLVEAHRTMLQNIPKRPIADPWSLETTTTHTPGEGSVNESTHEEAEEAVKHPRKADPTFFFFHREATPRADEDLDDRKQLRAAIIEASGPSIAAAWEDFEGQVTGIAGLYAKAKQDGEVAYFERVWLNRRRSSARQAFDLDRWKSLHRARDIPFGEAITLGFDGSRWLDRTALVATHYASGWQWPIGIWDPAETGGEIPRDEVVGTIDDAFERFYVVRLYGDPAQGWTDVLADASSRHGVRRVFEFFTDSRGLRRTADAMRTYGQAMRAGEVTHSGDKTMTEHIGNAHKRFVNIRDEAGERMWVIEKERPDSPFKIDAAMAGSLSWTARLDALTAGDGDQQATYGFAYA
jgi:phage terminase large subunit-like protein